MGAKVWRLDTSPEQWSRVLPSRDVVTARASSGAPQLIGAAVNWPLTDDVGAYQDIELVGDDEDEGADENGDSAAEMGAPPDVASAGPSGAPSFAPLPMPPTVPVRIPSAAHSVKHFRGRLAKGDPRAHRAYHALKHRAKFDPHARQALHMIHGGVVISGGVVSGAGSLLKLVLSPVAWGVHGIGRLASGVGNQLTKLSRKI